jgi:hypothetical protein
MISQFPEDEVLWLSKFFAGRNSLHWQRIATEDAPTPWLMQVMPWLTFLGSDKRRYPLILPVFGPDGPTAWYGLAYDEHMASMLAEEIGSVLGPSYTDFRGQRCMLSDTDEIEAALHARFGNYVFQFRPTSVGDVPEITRILLMYHGVLSRRPPTPDRTQRPFGKIRGDFDRALLAGNESGANRLLNELCESGRVSAEQRKCLEIRLLAGLGRQEEIARNHSLISTVADLALPPQTITDLIDALYETYITPVEAESDPAKVIAVFKQCIAKSYGPLFRERKGIRQPKVLRAFLLFEISQDEPNRTRCEAILSAYPEDAEGRSLAQHWLESRPQRKSEHQLGVLDRARQAIADEDYEIAVDLSFQAIPNPWAYSALLRCAIEVRSADITSRVLDAMAQAPVSVQRALNAKDRSRLEQLRALTEVVAAPQVDTNWVVWARWVMTGVYEQSPTLVLESAVVRWSVDDYARDPELCSELARLIGNAAGQPEQIFRDAVPHLVEFFVDRPAQPVRTFAPLYSTLVKVVAWSGALSPDELELASSLIQALMLVGPSKAIYVDCLTDLCEIVGANSSPAHLDWALNTAEMLALYPAQDEELRLRFFAAVIGMVRAGAHRITNSQRLVLELLAKDYNCLQLLELLPTAQSAEDARSPDNYASLIGIYTMTESAGQRAKHILQKLLPAARIELNGDSVATDRLKHLARNADVFVFAWKSSKHQAYYCAKEARGHRTLHLPTGKGTASIVRTVLSAVNAPHGTDE